MTSKLPIGSLFLLGSLTISISSPATVRLGNQFKWCTATSAHQIEGGNRHSDWWKWEQEAGLVARGETSGRAAGHWNRVVPDTGLQVWLGTDRYRFSIEWAKIEPAPGQWNQQAIAHYVREIELLRAAGIEPMVTLNHFTLPQWVADQGSWTWIGIDRAFARFTSKVVEAFGDRVGLWVTLNEPMVVVTAGYLKKIFPPALGSADAAVVATQNMLLAHARAYHIIKRKNPGARVGIAKHLRVFEAFHRYNPAERLAARKLSQLFNWAFLEALETGRIKMSIPFGPAVDRRIPGLRESQDFLGINYYSRDRIKAVTRPPFFERLVTPGASLTDLGWEIFPRGLRELVKAALTKTRKLPVIITENGIADHRDANRIQFMQQHLEQIAALQAEGIVVEGYCHWSLMDNFEWREGFEPRFGLFDVDYRTLRRRPRQSARWYRDLIRRHKN